MLLRASLKKRLYYFFGPPQGNLANMFVQLQFMIDAVCAALWSMRTRALSHRACRTCSHMCAWLAYIENYR